MKKLAVILIALMGTAVVSYAQDGKKQTEPKKADTKNVTSEKKKVVVKKTEPKKEEKIKKVN